MRRPLGAPHRSPGRLSALRGADRGVHLVESRDGDVAQHLAGCRVEGCETARPPRARPPRRSRRRWPDRPRRPGCRPRATGRRRTPSSSARALSLSASRHPDSAARSHTPSIIAAIMAARLRRVVRRYELPQRTAQIRQGALLVHGLHADQVRRLQHLAPEREPGRAGALGELLLRQVGIDHRLDARPRRADLPHSRPDVVPHPPRQRTKGRIEEAVLVAEVVRHQPRGNARPPCDLRKRCADIPEFS